MTRNLIAEQLHATGLSIVPRPVIRSTSTPHNQMMYEYSTSGKSNRTFGNNGNALQGFGTGATIGCKTNGYPSEGGKETDEGDYCVTEDEFQALIDEIEAELEDDYGKKEDLVFNFGRSFDIKISQITQAIAFSPNISKRFYRKPSVFVSIVSAIQNNKCKYFKQKKKKINS